MNDERSSTPLVRYIASFGCVSVSKVDSHLPSTPLRGGPRRLLAPFVILSRFRAIAS